MKKLLLLVIILCIPLTLSAESSYKLSFFKMQGEPLDQPLLYNRLIELVEVTSNSTANIKIDGKQYEIKDEYKDIEGLRIKIEEAESRVQIRRKTDGEILTGQYATITFKESEAKEWNSVLFEGEELTYNNHNIKLNMVGITEDDKNAIDLEIDGKTYGLTKDDEQLYNGIIVKADHITMGRGITTQENIKATKLSITDDITLENYPLFFSNTDKDMSIITSRTAPVYVSIAATELILSIPKIDKEYNSFFDDEVPDNQNLISIGCNEFTKQYAQCDTEPGKGIIKLIKENDKFILLLLGYGENEVMAASNHLKTYQEMTGMEFTIKTTPSEVPQEETIKKEKEKIKKQIEEQSKQEPKKEIIEIKQKEPLVKPKTEVKKNKSVFTSLIEWIRALFSRLFGFLS